MLDVNRTQANLRIILMGKYMGLVERIKIKCKEKSTTMNALEKALNIGNGNIRRWNDNVPSADRLLKVANSLDTSVDWLLTGKEHGDLTPEEQRLVDTFRGCNSTGQDLIQEQAEAIRQKLPADPAEQPAGVSTSAIG